MKNKILLLLFVGFLFTGCKSQKNKNSITTSTEKNSAISNTLLGVIDYSHAENWAVLPGNYPASLKDYPVQNPQDSIDVFYVYPTLIISDKDERWNVPIDDSIQKAKVLNSAVRFQASAWASSGDLYVPYYRQAHIRSYSNLKNGGTTALKLSYSDVKASFEYYLEHYNHGRGIILAGHSQGSTHIAALLHDFFDGKSLQNQLVAAYVPGIGFDKNQFGTVPFMDQPSQIGGFVTWNTFKRKYDKNDYKWYKGKAVINPVTWDTTAIAERELHKGFLYSNGKMYKNSFATHLADGVIWISAPHFPYRYLVFLMRNYHTGDVNLFWEDINKNSLMRVQNYKATKKKVPITKADNTN
ncbi:DUF3089 domain-containing protein [uncultured Flavobacterium sp.]|jgi:hypothetical protein|uniref:DUF3089 domain-containing protein n=1 Tax=uncultured Flavobacterium sp. TaxID=165435 RepID=UPI0030CA5474